METRRARLVALIAVLCAAATQPCGWDFTPALAFRVRPDDPIDRYVGGRLGVLQPTYARSHLVVAYRYLSGNPPTAAERKGFLALLAHRLHELPGNPISATEAWEKVRADVRGVAPGGTYAVDRAIGNSERFLNCTDGAFRTAAATLHERVRTFGAKSAAVLSWLDAQEMVFANCGGPAGMPRPADASLPAIIRADREYQIGAAHFYALRWNDARAQFFAIARDPRSPWKHIARLVAVRALLRQSTAATTTGRSFDYAPQPMRQAELELRAILADPSEASIHEPARQLLRFVIFRTKPAQRLAEAVAVLAGNGSSASVVRAELDDYTYLLDGDVQSADDLTDWVRTFQSGKPHALERWRATKKPHWLVAALVRASADDSTKLLAASESIDSSSPAYPTIAYHRARLLLAANHRDDARAELDRVLALGDDRLPHSARNLLLAQRRSVARSLHEFVRDASAIPVGYASEQRPADELTEPVLPPDAAETFNASMPLDMLADAALSGGLADTVRTHLQLATWTRAILLDREDVAARIAPPLIARFPHLESRYVRWRNAQGSERRFEAANLIVHFGALQPRVEFHDDRLRPDRELAGIEHGERNWWRADDPTPPAPPPFLEPLQATAARERLALHRLGSGPTWLLRAIIDWSNAHPNDARVPEALALAIAGTRWSHGDAGTEDLAHRAFNLLHRRYPGSKWAKQTKYWYLPLD